MTIFEVLQPNMPHAMGNGYGPTWARTRDRPVMSRWLYQLSYGPVLIAALKYRQSNNLSSISKPLATSGQKPPLIIDKTLQFAASGGMTKLAQSFGLNLPDSFAGHGKILSDLFEGMVGFFSDAKAHS